MISQVESAGGEGERPRQGRREEMLDLASRRLNAAGVSSSSIAEIAGLLGVTRTALYAYVRDREDLIFQCYQRSCEIMQARFTAAAEASGDPFDILAGFIANVLDPAQPEAAALSELGGLHPDQRQAIQALRDDLVSALARTVSDGQAAGVMRDLDPQIIAHAVLSLVYWLKLAPRWLSEEANLPRANLEAAARTLLFEGVGRGPIDVAAGFINVSELAPQLADVFDRQAVAAAKLDRMLAAASRLFNVRGVDTTSVEEIAAALGITKRTIYNHFPDKLALIAACQLRGYRIFIAIAERAAAWPGRRAEALAAAFNASVTCSFEPSLSPLRVFSGLPGLPPKDQEAAAKAGARLREVYGDLLNAGVDDGSLRSVDMAATQLAMVGMSSWVGASADLHPQHVARQLTELVLLGLKPADRRRS